MKTREERKAQKAQRDGITNFAKAMLTKLELRGEKQVETKSLSDPQRCQQGPLLGRKKDHDIWWYFRRLKGEVNELQGALQRHDIQRSKKTCLAVISESSDVANFAAAIAEKAVEDER